MQGGGDARGEGEGQIDGGGGKRDGHDRVGFGAERGVGHAEPGAPSTPDGDRQTDHHDDHRPHGEQPTRPPHEGGRLGFATGTEEHGKAVLHRET